MSEEQKLDLSTGLKDNHRSYVELPAFLVVMWV